MRLQFRTQLVILSAVVLAACGTPSASVDNDQLVGADEANPTGSIDSALSSGVPAGSILATTANLNLRSGPSTSNAILKVIPQGSQVTAVTGVPDNGWYQLKWSGVTGWSSGAYLKLVSSPSPTPTSTARDLAIGRAKEGVGFSYWWGHGRFQSTGPTSSTEGACYGSCPSCSHSGTYGADCSGFAAKVWVVPSTNDVLSTDLHPYSTYNFNYEYHGWSDVSRGSALKADAFVYNSGSEGHIFIFESGDPWGSMWTYEARGCSYGIVHNVRTATSAYKVIRRSGY